MRQQTRIQYAVCPACKVVVGEGATLGELAPHAICRECSGPTVVRARPPGQRTAKRHHGGLSRKKYLDPETLRAFRKWMLDRAKKRKSRTAWTDHVIVEILSRTGLRSGELASTVIHPERYLRIGDVHMEGPEIEVKVGKGEVSRVVQIPQSLAKLIAWYIETYRVGAGPNDPLISSGLDSSVALRYATIKAKCVHWTRDYAEHVYKSGGLPMGLKLHPHIFRHSFSVDFLARNGNDYRALSEILGHSDVGTTMNTYCHTSDGKMRAMAEKMQ